VLNAAALARFFKDPDPVSIKDCYGILNKSKVKIFNFQIMILELRRRLKLPELPCDHCMPIGATKDDLSQDPVFPID